MFMLLGLLIVGALICITLKVTWPLLLAVAAGALIIVEIRYRINKRTHEAALRDNEHHDLTRRLEDQDKAYREGDDDKGIYGLYPPAK